MDRFKGGLQRFLTHGVRVDERNHNGTSKESAVREGIERCAD